MDFSVIIPTYNRPAALARCLASFSQLRYPAERWEIIVVNDGGANSFAGITDRLKNSLPLHLVEAEHKGPAAVRNLGAALAQADYLAFTDDDCVVKSDWLEQFARGWQQYPAWAGLGGQLLNPYPGNPAAEAWQRYLDYMLTYFEDIHGHKLLLTSNNVTYRRTIFNDLGGFDETFPLAAAEDLEFGYRLAGYGYRQHYFPPAQVWHYHHSTYQGYLKQQFRYGRGAYYFHQKQQQVDYPQPIETPKRYKGQYYVELFELLWQIKAPPGVWLLVGLTSPVHSWGRRLEGRRNRSKPRS